MSEKKKILIYTCGEVMGDGVIKLPFISALKRAMPDMHLTWCCSNETVYKTALKEIAETLIDEIIVLPEYAKISFKDIFSKHPLSDKYYDIILDTQTKLKPTLWLKKVPHGKFISATYQGLLSTVPIDKKIFKEKKIFKVLMMLGSLLAGKELKTEKLDLPDDKYLDEAKRILPDGKKYLGFIVGAGQPFKLWPMDSFIAVAKNFIEKGFMPAFFLGPMEEDMSLIIKEALPEAVIVFGAPDGMKGCYLTMALGQRVTASVTNDSGGSHLIATGAAPMVIIYSSRNVSVKFQPQIAKVIPFCPEDFGGSHVKDIPFNAVAKAIEKIV